MSFFSTTRRRCRVGIIAVLLLGALPAPAQRPITRIDKIKALPVKKSAKALPVEVEAQMVWRHPRSGGFFLFDGSSGIYVRCTTELSQSIKANAGDIVRVKGVTNEGGFSPAILATSVEYVRTEPLPKPREYYLFENALTTVDCDWVSVHGRIISMTVLEDFSIIMLELEVSGVSVSVQLPDDADAREKISEIMFRHVQFDAVAGTLFNPQRQAIGRIFFVTSADKITPVDGSVDTEKMKLVPIEKLLRYGQMARQPVRTRGVVIYAEPSKIFLRGGVSCVGVSLHEATDVQVGDFVELEGFVTPQPISPGFRARKVTVLEHRKKPRPVKTKLRAHVDRVHNLGLIDPALSFELIQLNAQLVETGKSFGLAGQPVDQQVSLLCRSGLHLFEARLPPGVPAPKDVTAGAKLQLTGICNLIQEPGSRWRMNVDGMWLQLRGIQDIQVVSHPSWWTAKRLLWLLGIMLGASLLFLFWVGMLRRTVGRQTGIIAEKIERESVLNERQRIARELHDTLEQGLTAVSVQLRNIHRKIEKKPAETSQAVELAENMLRVCREESRASIIDLRGGILERMDLCSAIRHTLEPLLHETGITLSLEVHTIPDNLMLSTQHHLLRMIMEASNNAIRHASPQNLFILMDCAEGQLSLSVRDDGSGFALDTLPSCGRFGVSGMYERANRLNGTLKLDSTMGIGTTVFFVMPVGDFLKE